MRMTKSNFISTFYVSLSLTMNEIEGKDDNHKTKNFMTCYKII